MQGKACREPTRLSPSPPVNLLLTGQLIGSPASTESGNLFACTQQRTAIALTDPLIEQFY